MDIEAVPPLDDDVHFLIQGEGKLVGLNSPPKRVS